MSHSRTVNESYVRIWYITQLNESYHSHSQGRMSHWMSHSHRWTSHWRIMYTHSCVWHDSFTHTNESFTNTNESFTHTNESFTHISHSHIRTSHWRIMHLKFKHCMICAVAIVACCTEVLRAMTHARVWHDSFNCVMYLIHTYDSFTVAIVACCT